MSKGSTRVGSTDCIKRVLETEGIIAAVNQCRRDCRRNEHGYRKKRFQLIVDILRCTRWMQADPKRGKLFLELDFWREKAYKPKAENMARLVAMYAYNTVDTANSDYETARRIGALVAAFIEKGVETERVFAFLEKAGSAENAMDKLKPRVPGNENRKTADNCSTRAQPLNRRDIDSVSDAQHQRGQMQPGSERDTKGIQVFALDSKRDLVISAGREILKSVLSQEIGRQFTVCCKRVKDDENGFRRFEAISISH